MTPVVGMNEVCITPNARQTSSVNNATYDYTRLEHLRFKPGIDIRILLMLLYPSCHIKVMSLCYVSSQCIWEYLRALIIKKIIMEFNFEQEKEFIF